METGPWVLGPGGRATIGALGVLVDDVLAAAIVVNRPQQPSVSTEILIDLTAPVPSDGQILLCRARTVHLGADSGLARGEITTADGAVVAVATQRQRFLASTPTEPDPTYATRASAPGESALERLAARFDDDGGLTLTASPQMLNKSGVVHGGVILCASSLVGEQGLDDHHGSRLLASARVTYLRPIPASTETTFTIRVVHLGRNLAVAHVTGVNAGRVCSTAVITQQV
jgi:uncharacterized protein (TIGR00369 family)